MALRRRMLSVDVAWSRCYWLWDQLAAAHLSAVPLCRPDDRNYQDVFDASDLRPREARLGLDGAKR